MRSSRTGRIQAGGRSGNPRSRKEVVRAPALTGAHPGDDVSTARRGYDWARTGPAAESVGASNLIVPAATGKSPQEGQASGPASRQAGRVAVPYLFDTDALSEVFKPRPSAACGRWPEGSGGGAVHERVVGELFTGSVPFVIRRSAPRADRDQGQAIDVLSYDVEVARVYGAIQAGLEDPGPVLADAVRRAGVLHDGEKRRRVDAKPSADCVGGDRSTVELEPGCPMVVRRGRAAVDCASITGPRRPALPVTSADHVRSGDHTRRTCRVAESLGVSPMCRRRCYAAVPCAVGRAAAASH
jgi:predicted nucleic acid-binding protein